ncbi:hypothetical protein [Sorangium sp. So ce887]|uniref:hypothetical protein n=1 Tax=Sorangium sp. So ce887 TaxID=3133324 RepID=UPI003F631B07
MHAHHGREFWAALGRVMPDDEARRARLESSGQRSWGATTSRTTAVTRSTARRGCWPACSAGAAAALGLLLDSLAGDTRPVGGCREPPG